VIGDIKAWIIEKLNDGNSVEDIKAGLTEYPKHFLAEVDYIYRERRYKRIATLSSIGVILLSVALFFFLNFSFGSDTISSPSEFVESSISSQTFTGILKEITDGKVILTRNNTDLTIPLSDGTVAFQLVTNFQPRGVTKNDLSLGKSTLVFVSRDNIKDTTNIRISQTT